MASRLEAWLTVIAVAVCFGCTMAPARTEEMIPKQVRIERTHRSTVHVRVIGGQEYAHPNQLQIRDPEFRGALVTAIGNTKLFRSVVDAPKADYLLEVKLLDVRLSVKGEWYGGTDATGGVVAAWSLVHSASKKSVWSEKISSSHTTTPGEVLLGPTRMRVAQVGAARANILAGLEKISGLTLRP